MNRIICAALCAAVISAGPQIALAHATLETATAKSGAPWKGVVRIGHGCEGTATTNLRISIPEGVIGVHPMPKAGWKLEIISGLYAKPYDLYGKSVTEGARELIWSGGSLPDAFYDEFVFTGMVAKGVSGTLPVPVIQTCEKGLQNWTEIAAQGQDAHALGKPAPVLTVMDGTSAPAYTLGALTITAPWTRATPKGAEVGGGYVSVTNTGKEADRLVNGSVSVASRFEFHEMATVDGVMQMRQLENGLEIKPGQTVELKPGGLHIMMMGLTSQIKDGDRIKGTLVFEKAGTIEVEFVAGGIGSGAPTAAKGEAEHVHVH